MEEEDGGGGALRQLKESIDLNPDDPVTHYNLGLLLRDKGKELKEIREKAAEHFLISVKLNPQNSAVFRYSQVLPESCPATLCPDDSQSGVIPHDDFYSYEYQFNCMRDELCCV
ncbi:uncharacterized protein LOC130776311 [Actinidia eriantha]|uniref:uncharacterized protein LOC130776311 n=1 Tax=Actinidia eriantha TaxID=165200 RepID=UPI00258AE2D5|nr:uncharacterized protein LOC130776311 [Actinidia eriantha]